MKNLILSKLLNENMEQSEREMVEWKITPTQKNKTKQKNKLNNKPEQPASGNSREGNISFDAQLKLKLSTKVTSACFKSNWTFLSHPNMK